MSGAGAVVGWQNFFGRRKREKAFLHKKKTFLLFNFFLFLAGRNWTEEIFLQPSFHVFTKL